MTSEQVSEILLQFFALPFAVIFIAMLVQMAMRPHVYDESIPWDDTQREAYISVVIGAIVTVAVTLIIGGPEPFVLFWRPLITTVIMLPLAFAAALVAYSLWLKARR